MNFREHFEAWHKKQYGYIGKMAHHSTELNTFYQTTACQQRWEAWQACADWHTAQSIAQQLQAKDAAIAKGARQ